LGSDGGEVATALEFHGRNAGRLDNEVVWLAEFFCLVEEGENLVVVAGNVEGSVRHKLLKQSVGAFAFAAITCDEDMAAGEECG